MKPESIQNWEEVLQSCWFGWQIITPNQVLREFLTGDAAVWSRNKDAVTSSSGGNCIDWDLEGENVILSHQYADDLPKCSIRLSTLQSIIQKLKDRARLSQCES